MAPIPIPSSSSAHAKVSAGQRIKVMSTAGTQVFDFFAFAPTSNPPSFLSMQHTRAALFKTTISVGDTLISNTRAPLLNLIEDNTSGVHCTLFPACDPHRYAKLGQPDHPSCVGNLIKETEKAGVELARNGQGFLHTPAPLNLFMNVEFGEDGGMTIGPADGTEGGYVVFGAEEDCVVIVCACSMDLVPGNGEALTGGEMEVLA